MEELDRLAIAGLIPVATIENRSDATPIANALLMGGLDVMEVTFRTDAAADAIDSIRQECPDVLVGAGTIISIEQCKIAVEAGAKFIVSPGFSVDVVQWCVEHGVLVIPGCVTASEIMWAKTYGLQVVKYFPADLYGGVAGIKALAGPFHDIKFIPTGGVNLQNIGEYSQSPYVYAVGGSWVCKQSDIAAQHFDKISKLCQEARQAMLGYEIAHLGINCHNPKMAMDVCKCLSSAFGFTAKEGNSSYFVTSAIEVIKSDYLGGNGHIAIRTNRINMAIADLEKKGYSADMNTATYKEGCMTAVYLKENLGGFAIHLLQR